MKLELLTATVIDDAINFVSSIRATKGTTESRKYRKDVHKGVNINGKPSVLISPRVYHNPQE